MDLNSNRTGCSPEPNASMEQHHHRQEEERQKEAIDHEEETIDAVWSSLQDYWKRYGLASHQKQSYDSFIHNLLPHIIAENSDVTTQTRDGKASFHIQFTNPCLLPPTVKEADGWEKPILPNTARLRGLSYTSTCMVDVVHDKVDQTGEKPTLLWRRVYREVVLCRIPVMVQSSACYLSDPSMRGEECAFDEGGYFVINGHEKALLSQEKLRTNHAFVFHSKLPKLEYTCEVRSCHELKMRSTSTLMISTTRPVGGGLPDVVVQLPFLESTLSLPCVFKVLGAETQEEAMSYIQTEGEPELEAMLRSVFDSDVHSGESREEIFDFIGRHATHEVTRERRTKYTSHILSNELLPHIGLLATDACHKRKLHYIGHMVRKLLLVQCGKLPVDDRDSYVNKRADSAGTLLSLLMRQLYRNHLKAISVLQSRLVDSGKIEKVSLGDMLADKRITSGLKYAFATGNWGVTKNGISAQNGVAQVVSRMTALSAKSNLRRLSTPLTREGQSAAPRLLHTSSWGLVCPSETPEGSSCGLTKNLAVLCAVRHGTFSTPICQLLLRVLEPRTTPLLRATEGERRDGVLVHVNGVITGVVSPKERAEELAAVLRSGRRQQWLPHDMSVTLRDRTLLVATDPGALCRPLIVRSELGRLAEVVRSAPAWENRFDLLLREGIVEFVDKDEEMTNLRVATSIEEAVRASSASASASASASLPHPPPSAYTHVELDPSLILGVCSSLIPFPDHNQAPRNTYQAAMGKQAVSCYSTRWMNRMDSISHVLCYPARPIVATRAEEMLGGQLVPSGNMLMVAIMAYGGFNQEDSVIASKAAIDRGALRSTVFRAFKDEERRGADSETFCNPERSGEEKVSGLRRGCYSKIDDEGRVKPGTRVDPGDVVIGKCVSTSDVADRDEARPSVLRDKSTLNRFNETATVDAVFESFSREGNRTVKVRTRATRIPTIGDKVSSRMGQKGVIGDVMPEEDLPFCARTGMKPDLIVNPHAIPSRMTVGQLVEALLGIACCKEGKRGDGTPFRGVSVEQIGDEMERHGLQRYGNTTMVNGQTGETMPCLVFLAPTFYQRLKHMVKDKIHARARGATQILTRQPLEGRSREGGLRFGEMERDCLIAHGASSVLLDRLFHSSDPFQAPLCRQCGLLAQPDSKRNLCRNTRPVCNACGSTDVVMKDMPYATKLFFQELMAMGIAPRINVSSSTDS